MFVGFRNETCYLCFIGLALETACFKACLVITYHHCETRANLAGIPLPSPNFIYPVPRHLKGGQALVHTGPGRRA